MDMDMDMVKSYGCYVLWWLGFYRLWWTRVSFVPLLVDRMRSLMIERLGSYVNMHIETLSEYQRYVWVAAACSRLFCLIVASGSCWKHTYRVFGLLQIASSLEQKCYKELRNENFHAVKIVMCIYKKLISSCREQMYVRFCFRTLQILDSFGMFLTENDIYDLQGHCSRIV